MSEFPINSANRPHRLPERISYEASLVNEILDEALICHLGFESGGPLVLPMIHARVGKQLYLHASTGSGLALGGLPAPVCVTVTVLDGLVLAKSQFHHSLNYRSVVVRGRASAVTDPAEKDRALAAIVEHVSPGRAANSRPPNPRELAATAVIRVPLDSVAAKVRSGGPHDDPEDTALGHWSGVVPVGLASDDPQPDDHSSGLPAPPPDPRLRRRG